MIACIWVFYLASIVPPALQPSSSGQSATSPVQAAAGTEDPDGLYARRDDPVSAARAEAIWAQRVQQNPRDFASAWKLARCRYWLGGHAADAERKRLLEDGIGAGELAVAIEPGRPEGHFWKAANMGALAESFGLRQGLKYRGTIKDELMTVLKLDRAFQEGSADRALGRWYFKVPGLFGGSKQKAEEHLKQSLQYGPDSTASHFFLAELYLDQNREEEARAALQHVAAAPIDPDWAPEDREFKAKAKALIVR